MTSQPELSGILPGSTSQCQEPLWDLWVEFPRNSLAQGWSMLHPGAVFAAQQKRLNSRMFFPLKTRLWCVFLSNGVSPAKSQNSPWIGLLVFCTQGPWILLGLLEIPIQNIFSLILSELSQTVPVQDGTDVEEWKSCLGRTIGVSIPASHPKGPPFPNPRSALSHF